MFRNLSRRAFLNRSVQAGALAGLGNFAFLDRLPVLSAADVSAPMIPLGSDMGPLVRLVEDSPRPKLLETIAHKIQAGTSYQQLLSALMLAGVRSIRPRPVGFEFHCVLVVNSAHLATLASSDRDRWLPLFWALDNFKHSQEIKKRNNDDWKMPALADSRLPSATAARQRFIDAMDKWDVEAADLAAAALARTCSAGEVYELFWRYGARDFRDIGHKAIYTANSWRTLQTIGWRHAEPIVRSLAYALLERSGDKEVERPWMENLKRVKNIPDSWQQNKRNPEAGKEVLNSLRSASADEACDAVVKMLGSGVHPESVWDGLFLLAGELLSRQPGIVGLHCVTSINALHFAYQTTASDDTRRMVLLQGAAFLPLFRKLMGRLGKLNNEKLDALEPIEAKGEPREQIESIFAAIPKDRTEAARKTLALATKDPAQAEVLMAAARRLVFAKGSDSHDYKFSSAALEDYYSVTPRWRPYYLASSMFHLRGAGDRDSDLIKRVRELVKSV